MDKGKNIKNGSVFVMLVLFVAALAFSGWRNFRKGIYIGDDFFYRINDALYKNGEERISLEKNSGGTQFFIQLDGETQSAGMQWNDGEAKITYEDGMVIAGSWSDCGLCGKDGIPLAFQLDEVTVAFGEEKTPVSRTALSNALCRIDQNMAESRGFAGAVVVGMILYLIGALTFLYPNEAHFFFRRWAYQQAELSDAGVLMEKIGGIVAMLGGLLIITGIFLY